MNGEMIEPTANSECIRFKALPGFRYFRPETPIPIEVSVAPVPKLRAMLPMSNSQKLLPIESRTSEPAMKEIPIVSNLNGPTRLERVLTKIAENMNAIVGSESRIPAIW